MLKSSSSLSLLKASVVGIVVGGVGIGVAELIAGFSRNLRSPIFDVGDRVVDNVPGWLKDLAIEWFGTNDKIALLAGIGFTLLIYSALVGIVTFRRGTKLGIAGVSIFSIIGSISALTARGDSSWWMIVPSVIGGLTGIFALLLIYKLLNPQQSTVESKTIDKNSQQSEIKAEDNTGRVNAHSRRKFLLTIGGFAFIAASAGATGRWLNGRFSAAKSRAEVLLPLAKNPLPKPPVGIETVGATPFFTPNDDFYKIDIALTVPQIPVDTWNLRVHGMVDKEINLSFDDLLKRDLVESDITLTCVSNVVGGELVGTARWLGIRLDDLLEEAGINPAADQIVGRSVDGYTCGFPVETLDGRDALVAVGMNGEALPLDHGFPARLIVPGLYGYISATKWLTEIELTTFDAFDQYWVPQYADRAPIKIQSRIDSLQGLQRIKEGETVIGGVAWAQPIGIEEVEIQIDEEPWVNADLAEELNTTTWRQWTFPWNASSGRHTITVRAKDRNGAIQTDERSEPLPDGATGLHKIVVLVDAV